MSEHQERQIRDVLLDYCEHVDGGDVDAVVALFTSDATVDYGHGNLVTGHEALHRFFSERLVGTYSATSHHLSNIRIQVDADSDVAQSRCYIYAWHRRHDGSTADVWGRYHDVIRLSDDGWRIQKRVIRAVGAQGFVGAGGPTGPFEALPRRSGKEDQ